MHHATIERGTAPLEPDEANAVREWMERDGEAAVVESTGLSRLTVARAAARLSIHAGSRSAVRAALGRRAA